MVDNAGAIRTNCAIGFLVHLVVSCCTTVIFFFFFPLYGSPCFFFLQSAFHFLHRSRKGGRRAPWETGEGRCFYYYNINIIVI